MGPLSGSATGVQPLAAIGASAGSHPLPASGGGGGGVDRGSCSSTGSHPAIMIYPSAGRKTSAYPPQIMTLPSGPIKYLPIISGPGLTSLPGKGSGLSLLEPGPVGVVATGAAGASTSKPCIRRAI